MITHEDLLARLRYDRKTGVFTWLVRESNRVRVGDQAGSVHKRYGYLVISVLGRRYQAHRLAWFYVHGVWPKHQVDHRNGNRVDNRLKNLRDVPQRTNKENVRHAKRTNRIGVLGVSKVGNRFVAQIMVDRKNHNLGAFSTAKEAHAAYVAAKRQLHEGCTL